MMAPYILQIAIGIHATFEGLAIGIEVEVAKVLGIFLAVLFHKWAEGLTLVNH
jgi:zinc transporter 1/2/3